ncbi:ARM repeat-containing protein [Daedalea quercina L-15889]|uniref:ARM repeat-containing protein n=1 Tax=Daedalea quercina L-15889 TaxID=1314783 RepID=A0A165PGP7_9APHY|nr:ARM repeat-containing protein [Daedalea quercina L-15889]
MGIILSLFFPRLYMTTDNSAPSARSSSSRSSTSSAGYPRSPASNAPPSPFSDAPSSPGLSNPFVDQQEQQLPDRVPYNPHAVGLGIIAPQPILGPFPSIGRPSLSPIQTSSSPTSLRQRRLSSGPAHPGSPGDYFVRDLQSSEDLQLPPRLPGASAILSQTAADPADHLGSTSSSSGASTRSAGLQIAIPPPILSNSTSTPSPPLLPLSVADSLPSGVDPVALAVAAEQVQSLVQEPAPFFNFDDAAFPLGPDAAAPADINLDFTEFDSEGLNALEKIYLFSRSRAGFHRVFIVHALPRYLGAEDMERERYPSREQVDRISPADAVEYVLPLLNGLALDEDEVVKEALASELVNIIWWFITHCQLVEYEGTLQSADIPDTTPQPREQHAESNEDDVTRISVQAFTPILGTLLLSQNALVGSPARNAVVELLKRIWHADEREAGRPPHPLPEGEEPRPDYDTGHLRRRERRLFEREIVHQVVIGMGRLDLSDTEEGPLSRISTPRSVGEHHRDTAESQSLDYPIQTPPGPDTSTAGSTPLAAPAGNTPDSYFPAFPHIHPTAAPASSPLGNLALQGTPEERRSMENIVTPPAFQLNLPLPSPRREAAVNTPTRGVSSPVQTRPSAPAPQSAAAESAPTPAVTSPVLSPSPPVPPVTADVSSASVSSTSIASESSTPSLVSSSTSSSSVSTDSSTSLLTPSNSSSVSAAEGTVVPSEFELDQPGFGPYPETATGAEKAVAMTSEPVASPSRYQPTVSHETTEGGGDYFSGGETPVAAPQERTDTPLSVWLSAGLPEDGDVNMRDVSPHEIEEDISEEAAMGRLSSMSLMAAVTASVQLSLDGLTYVNIDTSVGGLKEDTKNAFVAEVERVGRDPVYWVRREAAFAVGALAKVVPHELVASSLLPLFETLYQDPTWHVRHSVLFALPAILSKLPPHRRRSLALDVILPLASDESPTVRSAVLESLGEVIYAFHGQPDGPPKDLLNVFLGVRDGHILPHRTQPESRAPPTLPPGSGPSSESSFSDSAASTDATSTHDIYDDPTRPLVCAFNFPAVALTLGRARWPELRGLYRSLARNPSYKVRRTLAASMGEIAKIIGPEYTKEDVLDVWWSSIDAEETEVRLKAIECAATFVRALEQPDRREVVRKLAEAFATRRLKDWREREEVVKSLPSFLEINGLDEGVLRELLMRALGDRVSAIREAAISVFPAFIRTWRPVPHWVTQLRSSIRELARSDAYRERTTYVTCEQALLESNDSDFIILDDEYWEILALLAQDPIVDVRIRAARLLGTISGEFLCGMHGEARMVYSDHLQTSMAAHLALSS